MNRNNLLLCGASAAAVVVFFGWMLVKQPAAPYRAATVAAEDSYTFRVQLDVPKAAVLKPNPFTVTIRQAGDLPVSGAAVNLTLSMPGMFCPPSMAQAVEVRPGEYRAEGIPFMAGDSIAEASIQVDGHTYRVRHPFAAIPGRAAGTAQATE